MKRFSLRHAQRLLIAGLFIAFSNAAAWAKNLPQESPGVAISVFNDSTLGISYLSSDGTGCQADIFYEGIEKLRYETFVDPAIILGHVAAHEIGHLLLGSNSHSTGGIMRAHWNMEELARANKRLLLFTKSQSHRMTEKLCVAMARRKWPSVSSKELSAEG